jgi:hypothetical protein
MAVIASSLSAVLRISDMAWKRAVQDKTQCHALSPVQTKADGLPLSAGYVVHVGTFVNIVVEVDGSLYHVFVIGNCPGYPTGTF